MRLEAPKTPVGESSQHDSSRVLCAFKNLQELVVFEVNAKRRKALLIRGTALNLFLKETNSVLLYRRFANRGYFDRRGIGTIQIDRFTYLRYLANRGPDVNCEKNDGFNC